MRPDKAWLNSAWLWLVGLLLTALLLLPPATARGEVHSNTAHSIPPPALTEPSAHSGFDRFSVTEGSLNFRLEKDRPGILEYTLSWGQVPPLRLCLQFRSASYLKDIFLYYRQQQSADWQLAATREFRWPLTDETVCMPFPGGQITGLRLRFTGGGGNIIQPLRATIDGISVQPQIWLDSEWVIYPLAALIGLVLMVPGFLLSQGLLANSEPNVRMAAIFPFSTLFFLLLYLGLWALQSLSWPAIPGLALLYVGLLAPLVILWLRARRLSAVGTGSKLNLSAMLAYLAAVVGVAALLAWGVTMPLSGLDYSLINQFKTYGAFSAHDPVLHYVNGRAIADQETFRKYYENRQLMFLVQDREILPGVMYAVMRELSGALSSVIGRSYATYTLFAAACNLMLVFPTIAFLRRYLPKISPWFVLAVLSLNAFVLVNYGLAWFKLAAAAMFLSGLVFLLQDNRLFRHWLLAGVSWGLAANLHAGSVLMIPLIFLWQFWSVFRWRPGRAFLYAGTLVAVFVITNVPWSLVKAHYYPDSHVLLKSHFLGGRNDPDGLFASAKKLWREVPLENQIKFRLHRLENAFRLTEVKEMPDLAKSMSLTEFYREWDLREFRYTAFYLYPPLLFSLLAVVLDRWRRQQNKDDLAKEAATLFRLAVATLFLLILAAYGQYAPDLTYHLPMALLVLIYLLAIRRIYVGPAVVRGFFTLFLIFSAWRLAAPYFA